jgi:hypothetical protein
VTTPNYPRQIPEAVLTAAEAAHAAPSADNLQPIGFRYKRDTLILCHRQSKGPTFPARHPATLIAAGAAVENVKQAAAAMNVPADISAVPSTANDQYVHIKLGQTAKPVASYVKSHALFHRHTNRHAYQPTPVSDALIARVSEMREESARIQVLRRPGEIRALAAFTQVASQARFRTAEIHAWFASSLRLTAVAAAQRDGLDVRTFDLPLGGRHLLRYIADWHRLECLNHLGAYRLLAAIEAKPIRHAPLLIAIIGDEPLSAGQLMERAWNELNVQGLAVQPFYVIPDQIQRLKAGTVPLPLRDSVRRMADDVRSMLGFTSDETLQMVLRVGWPTRKPFPSLRLPLENVLFAEPS